MLPSLPLGLHSYGLLVAVGFLLALWLIGKLARWHCVDPGAVQDAVTWGALAGLAGAKLGLLVVEPDVLAHPLDLLTQGGVFYAGLIAGACVAAWRVRSRGLSLGAAADLVAAPLAIAHAFGRIGCFMAGCCWGTRCDLPWAVTFTRPESSAVQGGGGWMPLHPVQLYEAAGNLALAAVALVVLGRRKFAGQAWWTYVAGYAVLRFGLEELRGDLRGEVWALSTSQLVASGALLVAAVAWGRGAVAVRRRARAGGP